jgi:UDP-N-acetylmuramate dehydrogenase
MADGVGSQDSGVSDLGEALRFEFGDRARAGVPLAPLTTFKVGGTADWLIETRSANEIVAALKVGRRHGAPITLLGGGSNVLVSDTGIRGLVIRPRGGEILPLDEAHVRADAAVTMNGLVRWTVYHGCAGLQTWAGTPGTVGGAIVGNAHFGGQLIGDLVREVRIARPDASTSDIPHAEMAFGYDRSRLQESGEVLLSAVFNVTQAEPAGLRATARESLAYRKRTQPLDTPSAGCVFQNPQPSRDDLPAGMPWSAGALVDRAGLKGTTVGGARVATTHGNFIVNNGTATARDIRRLIELCRTVVRDRYGVELRDEIVYLGDFDT